MLRGNGLPDKAVKFSNLYSKLLTQPVVKQKWAVLSLLHQLAEPNAVDVDTSGASGATSPYSVGSPVPQIKYPSDINGLEHEQPKEIEAVLEGVSVSTLPDRKPTRDTGRSSIRQSNADVKDYLEGNREGSTSNEKNPPPYTDMGLTEKNERAENPSEAALLRNLPFTLQGLSSTNLVFSNAGTLSLPNNLPLPLISLLHTLAEPSLLYRSLSDFVQSRSDGLIAQSLRSAMDNELRSYLGLIATLEGEIRRALVAVQDTDSRVSIGRAGVTLKRCIVWTREATLGLRLMSSMAEESKSECLGSFIPTIF